MFAPQRSPSADVQESLWFCFKVGRVPVGARVKHIRQLHGSKQLCQAGRNASMPVRVGPPNEVISCAAIPLFV